MTNPARVLVFPVESPIERAAHSTVCAIEDLDAAIWQAEGVDRHLMVHQMIEDAIKRLIISSSVAKTRMEYPQ